MSATALALVSASSADLATFYEKAATTLAEYTRFDQVKHWLDQAKVIEVTAKQAKDDTLLNLARRIKDRAFLRVGELLDEVPPAKGGRPQNAPREASDFEPCEDCGEKPAYPGEGCPSCAPRREELEKQDRKLGRAPTRVSAAADAGLTAYQAKRALQAASTTPAQRDALIEREKPATLDELAREGRKERAKAESHRASTAHLRGRTPKDYAAGRDGRAALRQFIGSVRGIDMAAMVRGTLKDERAEMLANAKDAKAWIEKLQRSAR